MCRSLRALHWLYDIYLLVGILVYFTQPQLGNPGIPKSRDLGIPILGFSGLKFAIRMLIINPVWHCNLPTTGVDAYPCNRLLIILGYFWTTLNCCATLVFNNLNPKTNGTLSELCLWHLHNSFRLLAISNTMAGRHTMPCRFLTIMHLQSRKRSLFFWRWKLNALYRMPLNLLLMIPSASIRSQSAPFRQLAFLNWDLV